MWYKNPEGTGLNDLDSFIEFYSSGMNSEDEDTLNRVYDEVLTLGLNPGETITTLVERLTS